MKALLHIMTRITLHTLASLIAVIVCGLVGYLAFVLIGFLVSLIGLEMNILNWIMYILITILSSVIAFAIGIIGPITKKYKREHKLPKIRPWMLYLVSLIYVVIIILALNKLIESINAVDNLPVLSNDEGDPLTYYLASPIVPLCVTAFYIIFFVTSILNISMNKCAKCGYVNCFIKVGESSHNYKHGTDYKYDSYDNNYNHYTSSGTHIGTVSGYGGSYISQERKITKETWDSYYECYHCNNEDTVSESKVTKEEWHKPRSEKKWWKD